MAAWQDRFGYNTMGFCIIQDVGAGRCVLRSINIDTRIISSALVTGHIFYKCCVYICNVHVLRFAGFLLFPALYTAGSSFTVRFPLCAACKFDSHILCFLETVYNMDMFPKEVAVR